MKLIKKVFTKSVFFKLFLGFLIVAIPMYGITIGAVWYGSRIVTEDAEKSMQEKLYFFTSYIEKELSNINQMLVALNMDNDLNDFYLKRSRGFSYEDFTAFNVISSKFKIISLTSDYINDVFLIFPKTGEEISINRSFKEISDNRKVLLLNDDIKFQSLNSYVDKEYIIYSISNDDNRFILGVEISQSRIIYDLKKNQMNNSFNPLLRDAKTGELLGGDALTDLDRRIFEKLKNNDINNNRAIIDGNKYIIKEIRSKDNLFKIIVYTSEKELFFNLLRLQGIFLLIIFCSLFIFLIVSLLINKQVQKPLRVLVKSMKEVERGNYDIEFQLVNDDEFGYVYKQFNGMVSQVRTLIQEVLEKKIQVQQAELHQLQSHINPHFLFNCFYVGYRMAKSGENESVAKLCKYLGDYFRFITYYSNGNVALKDEIGYIETYLNIQKLRYSDKFDFMISVYGSVEDVTVPGLIIQPLVENAMLHGIEKVNRSGVIDVRITAEEQSILIEVEDNGAGMTEEELKKLKNNLDDSSNAKEHYGLWNVQRRLRYLYGMGSGLYFNINKEGGIKVYFAIPRDNEAKGYKVI